MIAVRLSARLTTTAASTIRVVAVDRLGAADVVTVVGVSRKVAAWAAIAAEAVEATFRSVV